MKERISKVGGALEKTGLSEIKMNWPENFTEAEEICGKVTLGQKEIEITPAKLLGWAWRGFTLSFQGEGETLSEEEKAERKAKRAEESKVKREAKDAGIDLIAELRALIAARKNS